MPGGLCFVYFCRPYGLLSVFVSSCTPAHCVRAYEHGRGIMWVQIGPIGEQEYVLWMCMSGAQEACSCMTQVPHGTLALAPLSTTLQAGPSQEALMVYQYIHTNHLLKFNFNICWPDKYYADWKFCQHNGIIFLNILQDFSRLQLHLMSWDEKI